MTRRIVQISAWTTDESGGTDVLCDDGSVWSYKDGVDWYRLPDIPQDAPAEPDPIAEVEAMGAWMAVVEDSVDEHVLAWFRDSFTQEVIGRRPLLEDIRAAAARLLARVRGAK